MWLNPNRPAGDWPIALAAISAFGVVRSQPETSPFGQSQHWPQLMVKGTTPPVADLEVRALGSELDHLAHVLVAEDVAALHGRLVSVEQVKVGAADRTRGDF